MKALYKKLHKSLLKFEEITQEFPLFLNITFIPLLQTESSLD